MREKSYKITITFFAIAMVAGICLFALIITTDKGNKLDDNLNRIHFVGQYQTENMEKPAEYNSNVDLSSDNRKVIFRGHLDDDVATNVSIMLRVKNIRIVIYKNNSKIFSSGETHKVPVYRNSPENCWKIFDAKGTTTEDDLKIVLENPYSQNSIDVYNVFFQNAYKGNVALLLQKEVGEHTIKLILGAFVMLMGIVLLCGVLIMKAMKIDSRESGNCWLAMFFISIGLWFASDFNIISLVFDIGAGYNIFDNFNIILSALFFCIYLIHHFKGMTRKILIIDTNVQIAFFVLSLILCFMGVIDSFQLLTPWAIITCISVCTVIISISYEIFLKKIKLEKYIYGSLVFMSFGALLDCLNYLVGFSDVYYGFQVVVALTVIAFGGRSIIGMKDTYIEDKELEAREKKIMENHVATVVSQLQPHFMFNCLTGIQQLCYTNPELAEEAVGGFSSFLRVNLESLKNIRMIPFKEELLHIQNYLDLEKMRFGERLNIKYEIGYEDFSVPIMSLQPIVENAVRYGVTKKMEGGTIVIHSRKTTDGIIIEISDDGVGFEIEKIDSAVRPYTGLARVERMIDEKCHGTVKILSDLKEGTTVRIVIPVGGK